MGLLFSSAEFADGEYAQGIPCLTIGFFAIYAGPTLIECRMLRVEGTTTPETPDWCEDVDWTNDSDEGDED